MMEKIVRFEPAHHRGVVDGKNYGIGSVQIRFVLKGELGAAQLLLGTDWYLPEDQRRLSPSKYFDVRPNGWDLGYHSYKPMYEGQGTQSDSCPFLDGKPCYYDGSGLAADGVRDRLLAEGDAGVWAALTEYYVQTFGEER